MASKRAFMNVDPSIVGRSFAGGAAAGGGAAALLSLAHMIRAMRERKAQETAEDEEGTITLTLPPKAGASVGCPVKLSKVEGPKVSSVTGPNKQFRYATNGTFGNKTAQNYGQWQTRTGKWLAGAAGVAGGAALVNKVYQRIRERKLERELEDAQQEYMDLLQRGSDSKLATSMDELFPFDTPVGTLTFGSDVTEDKEAQSKWGLLSFPMAAAAVLTVMGTGGTAWLTKKVLDEKLREAKGRGLDVPQLRKIVLKTAPPTAPATAPLPGEEEEPKMASADEQADVRAALGVMMDKIGHQTIVLETGYVKEAMTEAGIGVRGMFKLAQDIDFLLDYLKQNPQLSRMIQRATMEKHPILSKFRWLTKMPYIKEMLDRKAQTAASDYFRPPQQPGTSIVGKPRRPPTDLAGRPAGGGPPTDLAGRPAGGYKLAGIGSDILGSLAGSAVVEKTLGAGNKNRQPSPAATPATPPAMDVSNIEMTAEDPEAQKYLDINKQRILQILEKMRSEGKV